MGNRSATTVESRLEDLRAHAEKCGLTSSVVTEDEIEDRDFDQWVEIEFRNGPGSRRLRVYADDAPALLDAALDKLFFLGDYLAFADETSDSIEALVVQSGPGPMTRSPQLSRIPGATVTYDEDTGDGRRWVKDAIVEVSKGSHRLSLASPSELSAVLLGRMNSRGKILRIEGYSLDRHDRAVRLLERLSGSFFFDLDVMYGVPMTLRRRRATRGRAAQSRSQKAPTFPVSEYAPEALTLYQYGRSAQGLPLLEFLAYYQSIEFFFPAFAHSETSAALRTELMNPRFNPVSDNDIARLIQLAAPAIRAGMGEREQLRATLRSATTREGVREAIARIEASGDKSLTTKGGGIKGTDPLRPDAEDLREQIAERIYAIRCRIVHTKRDGGSQGDELLLPTSDETSRLFADTALLRYVAQQAIFSQGTRRSD
ncbi:hypothetical protein [Microbacterium hydrocarbonoxydans]|uniref:hypothetical protein n=1 Tax=Microbacterium hydrocarbonoxydans TaxID=273678 RepID=UPI003D95C3B5